MRSFILISFTVSVNFSWSQKLDSVAIDTSYFQKPVEELKGGWTWAYRGSVSTENGVINVLLFLRTDGEYDFRIILKNHLNCKTNDFDNSASGQWKYNGGLLMLFPDSISSEVEIYKMITQDGIIQLNSADQEIISKFNPPIYYKCENKGMERRIRFSFIDECAEEIWKKRQYISN